ncbi:hypothetical protein GNP80_05525 [Aliivibrio fischeri]|uniref:type IV secretion system protein n=1 Tax=Aliivibrio fischeri TaxID=668 RepID=UPI0012D9C044|nr:type IV secretion system protein [Aliivibrio fischeri]MUK91895.1 hypothetical protein [Aliivibrio fischeri]
MKPSKFLAISFLFSSYAFSFGGVVTDPGSYTYYATQIETALKQLKQAEQQLKTAQDTYDSVTSIDKRLTGNLQRAQRSLSNFTDLKEVSIKDTRKSLQYAKKALDEVANISDYKADIEKQIDDVFGESERNDWVNIEAEKKASKQKALKQAIIDAETAQGKTELQLEHLTEFASAANSADTSKDAQDVTNALLLKMVENQGELITIMANISKNLALSEYDGEQKASGANIVNGKDLLKAEQWKSPKSKTTKSLSEMMDGCNPFEGCQSKN